MTTAIYIVVFSRGAWWVDLDGRSHGPFETCDQATEEAIARATKASDRGDRSEVRLSGPDRENELLYQSATRSLLSRTVALAQR